MNNEQCGWTLIDNSHPRFNRWSKMTTSGESFIESFFKNENPNNVVMEEGRPVNAYLKDTRTNAFYKKCLTNYFEDVFDHIPESCIHFHKDPSPNKWMFDLLNFNLRVTLICDDDGIVLEEKKKLKVTKKGVRPFKKHIHKKAS